jgi:uncharacterized protein (TIGR02646 family)
MVNFEKSQPAPTSLATEKIKANGTYRTQDVLEQLKNDFKNKCYICEDKAPTTINVEHFEPHRGDNNKKFAWENLFWVCSHCNNTKGDKTEYDNILNCTNSAHLVVDWIRYDIKPFPKEKAKIQVIHQIATNPTIVENTVQLLLEVYNGTTPLKIIESANIRQKLVDDICDFQKYLLDFYDDETENEEKENAKREIIKHLKKSSAFTAFKRWIIKENDAFKRDFESFFD